MDEKINYINKFPIDSQVYVKNGDGFIARVTQFAEVYDENIKKTKPIIRIEYIHNYDRAYPEYAWYLPEELERYMTPHHEGVEDD